MAEYGLTEVGRLVQDISDFSEMIRKRTRRAYRDLDELRRLTAQHDAMIAELKEKLDTERIRTNGTYH